MKKIIKTEKAPEAIGPYSQAVAFDRLLFTSGQIPISPKTGKLIEGDIREQTEQVLDNIKTVIEAAGRDLYSVLKTTVYLTKPENFAQMNEVYAKYFPSEPPARTTIFVCSLPKGALIEIDAVAKI